MGTNILGTLSFSQDALLTTDYANDFIVRGFAYNIERSITLAGNSSINFLLTPANGKNIIFFPISIEAKDSDVKLSLYEGTNYAGGSILTPYNLNRLSPNAAEVSVRSGASGSNLGDLLLERCSFAERKSSGSMIEGHITILDSSKKYLVILENMTATEAKISYSALFYEY